VDDGRGPAEGSAFAKAGAIKEDVTLRNFQWRHGPAEAIGSLRPFRAPYPLRA
jgi:hypothetical protein